MQPPPRKVKVTQEVKNCHSEQMNRLTIKHQTECDLLEDMRTYSLKKGQLERDYAQALQKLSSQYLKRDWPGISPDDQRTDYRNVYAVWRSYLEGTVQVSQSRLNVCENYKNQISDPAKTLRLYKEQQLKKTIDQLSVIQSELQDSVKELTKTKKRYAESEQLAQAVREREKSKLGLFQSRISLQKASVKLKAKRSDCNSKATQARNDYVLTLAAANAHHDRYYHTDLLTCIQALDGGVFDHVKDYLVSLCRTELETFQTTHSTFTFLLDKSSKVVQEFNQQLFMTENPVFKKTSDFAFLPSDNDLTLGSMQKLVDIEPSPISTMRMTLAQSRQMESDSSTTEEHSLNKEARKWATRLAREHKNILLHKRSLEECEGLGSAHLGSGQSEQSRADLELKSDDTKEHIRRAETVKLKAEARLDLLRQVGVAVDTWLKSAMNQVMEELENERWKNCTSHDPSLSEECEDNMEVFDDSSSSPSEVTLRSYPLTCKVIYCYKASQPDELTIDEGQMLEVIEDGDMEDWVKARSQSGKVGYVPEKYLQFPASSSSSVLSMLSSLAAPDALSMLGAPDALSMLSAPDARSHASSNSTDQETPNGDVHVHVRALYSYTAQTGEELSFSEGSVIRLLSRDTSDGQTDDGFWLGELGGRVGVFPSVLVEEVSESNGAPTGQEESLQFQKSALLPLPLYDQPPSPMMPFTSPGPLPRSPSTNQNGEHKPLPPPAPSHNKGPPVTHSRSPVSPGSALRFTPDGGPAPGKLRPVRAAPPPPKQPPRRTAEKTNEEVEITLV